MRQLHRERGRMCVIPYQMPKGVEHALDDLLRMEIPKEVIPYQMPKGVEHPNQFSMMSASIFGDSISDAERR